MRFLDLILMLFDHLWFFLFSVSSKYGGKDFTMVLLHAIESVWSTVFTKVIITPEYQATQLYHATPSPYSSSVISPYRLAPDLECPS
jgi:hypothetical protein